VTGTLPCPVCGETNVPSNRYCTSCGNALAPLEIYQGQQPSETDQCLQCGRLNPDGSAYYAACGRPLSTSVIPPTIGQASSRPRRASSRHDGLVAIKSLTWRSTRFLKRYTGRKETVKEGSTFCSPEAECYQADPTAFAFAS
jgi:predicted RNA-binding Zn-ribbon protein involved in translation (DUF1610 family)